MEGIIRALAATAFPCLCTTVGAASVFVVGGGQSMRAKRCMDGFAAGVMLAATVFSLLIPAIREAGDSPTAWMAPALGTLGGALALLWAERAADRLLSEGSGGLGRHGRVVLAITLHNLPEGMVVGLAAALAVGGGPVAAAGAAALAFGIGLQNLPEGAAVSLPLRQSGQSRLRAFAAGVGSGLVEPVGGVLAALAAAWVTGWMPWLLCLAAGAMLCATVQELLPQSTVALDGTLAFLSGFCFMMALDVAL